MKGSSRDSVGRGSFGSSNCLEGGPDGCNRWQGKAALEQNASQCGGTSDTRVGETGSLGGNYKLWIEESARTGRQRTIEGCRLGVGQGSMGCGWAEQPEGRSSLLGRIHEAAGWR